MSQEIDIEKIEQYLSGALSGQELVAFEKALSSNEELAKQVQLMRDFDLVLADEKAIEVQEKIQGIGQDFFTQEQMPSNVKEEPIKRLPFYRRPLAIAASILFIITAGALIWQMNTGSSSLSNEELFAQYYSVEKMNPTLRGDQQTDSLYQSAITQYKNKEYASAINIFNTLLQNDTDNLQFIYGLANAYLNDQQLANAEIQFRKIIADGKSIMTPKSIWYLALIKLKEGKVEEARKQLEQLRKTEDLQLIKQANALLKTLG